LRLVRLSIQRYRSIIDTERFRLGDFTVLVGPNNEGKSNILQALVTSMSALAGLRQRPTGSALRRRVRDERFMGGYDWERDFPRSLQDSQPDGTSIFNLDFELTTSEIREFGAAVGSTLNGILPVTLTFGPTNQYTFAVRKQRHAEAFSAKRAEIEPFIADHVQLQYIPAARTSEAALDVVDSMIIQELRVVEKTEEYANALETIRAIQRPAVEKLELGLCQSMQQILPAVRAVQLDIEEDVSRRSRVARICVDDGAVTDLAFKGDGMQSLAAFSLIRHYSEDIARGRELILAVEEPEAHLHPGAVHEIAAVLRATAESQQIVISTHSPLLVNRVDLGSNLIVQQTKARAARSVRELREALGVRTSDNLEHADVILIVEGPGDQSSVAAILQSRSARLRSAVGEGTLAVSPLFGGAKLPYVLRELRDSMCRTVTFLDDDGEGRQAAERARDEGLLDSRDEFFTSYPGSEEAELEDTFALTVYADALAEALGVNMEPFPLISRDRGKWSQRMRLLMRNQGKRWDGGVEARAKAVVAESVAEAPRDAVDPQCDGVYEALVAVLDEHLSRR
jgi:predicted ATPase